MKVFHCSHCEHLVFFENIVCMNCDHKLAFISDVMEVGSLDSLEGDLWSSSLPAAKGRTYRLCDNYREAKTCNWAVDAADPNPLCVACRLTRVIPDLNVPGAREAWFRLELAKRRVIYSLLNLGLPLAATFGNHSPEPATSASVLDAAPPETSGLAFQFLADSADQTAPVLTGHANGMVTVNIAEADDAERERRRRELGEPYRTLLGHLRHETGHYYWTQLVHTTACVESFRALFGDERNDYAESLQRHYREGPPSDWQDRFVSAYASAHPWEDWAETWAHFLYMTDTLETAAACGVSLRPRRADEPSFLKVPLSIGTAAAPFERLIDGWQPLTNVLNNLNRGMGLPDAYPFVLSPVAIDKLRFVHDAVAAAWRR